jgi:hypothetical protein
MPRKSNAAKITDIVPDTVVANTVVPDTIVTNTVVPNTEVKTRKPRVSKKDISANEVVAINKNEVAAINKNEVAAINKNEVAKEVVKDAVVEAKPKRGRKSKQELLTALNATTATTTTTTTPIKNTVELVVNEKQEQDFKQEKQDLKEEPEIKDENDDDVDLDKKDGDDVKTTKKRGRKPKGGKIIQNFVANETQKIDKPNIILHLKCSLKDLQQPSSCLVESYNFNSGNLNYDLLNKNENITRPTLPVSNSGGGGINDIKGFNIMVNPNLGKNEKIRDTETNDLKNEKIRDIAKYRESDLDLSRNNYSSYNNDDDDYDDDDEDDEVDNKTCSKNVWRKLKQLEHNLHINNVNNKKSACFWCTCDFDNPPVYVPKHYINGTYHVYGCFCSPECGVAHLMNEPIDSSAKFERYHLLNHIYSKIYDYKKNIKPAPNPYYMLEKFYGNLSIQEYRSLLRNERLFLIVDKPLTRILPELHEDNDEFILNNKIIASNNYQLKSRMQKKKPSKGLIMNEKFGLAV